MKTATILSILLLLAAAPSAAGDEKLLQGTYRLTERTTTDGKTLKEPDVLGVMTFTKTTRTVILKWTNTDGKPVSIALIARYTLENEKYCETVDYGVEGDLRAPGVSYDAPATAPSCTAAIKDAAGLAFDIPGETLRLRVTRDGIVTTAARWSDHWAKVK